jgi:hypothetical protein
LDRKKQEEKDRKLMKLERQGGVNSSEIMNMMRDTRLIDRYSKHLSKIIFNHSDPYIKKKYQAFLNVEDPNLCVDFFGRMKID